MREAAVMLVIDKGLILSISRRHDSTKFGLAGGKVEEHESPKEAAIRETFEETGIKVNECSLIYSRIEPKESEDGEDFNTHCFYATFWSGTPHSSEEGNVVWLTAAELTSSDIGAFPEYNANTLDKFRIKYPEIKLL